MLPLSLHQTAFVHPPIPQARSNLKSKLAAFCLSFLRNAISPALISYPKAIVKTPVKLRYLLQRLRSAEAPAVFRRASSRSRGKPLTERGKFEDWS